MSPGFERLSALPASPSTAANRYAAVRQSHDWYRDGMPASAPVFDVPLWVFVLSRLSGARAGISASPWPETNPGTADALSLIV